MNKPEEMPMSEQWEHNMMNKIQKNRLERWQREGKERVKAMNKQAAKSKINKSVNLMLDKFGLKKNKNT